MPRRTLILSGSYLPQRVVSTDTAVRMIFSGRIGTILETADELMGVIPYDRLSEFDVVAKAYGRSPGDGRGDLEIQSPSVAVSKRIFYDCRRDLKFTRKRIYARDSHTCQYCGFTGSKDDLNFDHVVPRKEGGRTSWDNVVTSCYPCNSKKGGRTPEEAGMRLTKEPIRPSWQSVIREIIIENMDDSWAPYLIGRTRIQ